MTKTNPFSCLLINVVNDLRRVKDMGIDLDFYIAFLNNQIIYQKEVFLIDYTKLSLKLCKSSSLPYLNHVQGPEGAEGAKFSRKGTIPKKGTYPPPTPQENEPVFGLFKI